MNLTHALIAVVKHKEALKKLLDSVNEDEFVKRYSRSGRVFYRCRDCGRIGWFSYTKWRRNPRCICGSRNLEKISIREFAYEMVKKRRSELEKMIRFLDFAKDALPVIAKLCWSSIMVDIDTIIARYKKDTIIIERVDNEIRVLVSHYASDREDIIQGIIKAAKKHGFSKVVVELDPATCISKDKTLRKLGYVSDGVMYSKVVEL